MKKKSFVSLFSILSFLLIFIITACAKTTNTTSTNANTKKNTSKNNTLITYLQSLKKKNNSNMSSTKTTAKKEEENKIPEYIILAGKKFYNPTKIYKEVTYVEKYNVNGYGEILPITPTNEYLSFAITKEPSKSNKAYATKEYLDTVIINKAVPIEFKGYEIPKERQFMIAVRSQTKMTRLGMILTPKGEDYFKYRNIEVCKYYTIKKYEDIFTTLEDVKNFIAKDGGVLEKNVPAILKAIEYNIYLKLNENRIYDKEKKDAESLKELKDNAEHTANFNLPSVNWAKKPAFKIGYENFSYLLYSTDDIEGAIKYFKEKLPKIGYDESSIQEIEEKLRSKGFYNLIKEREESNKEELDIIEFFLGGKSKRGLTSPYNFGFEELGYFDKVHTVEDFDKVEKGELMY